MTDDWLARLTQKLEPMLRETDPRPQISAYHDMPYAIFRYPPEDEFAVRKQLDSAPDAARADQASASPSSRSRSA